MKTLYLFLSPSQNPVMKFVLSLVLFFPLYNINSFGQWKNFIASPNSISTVTDDGFVFYGNFLTNLKKYSIDTAIQNFYNQTLVNGDSTFSNWALLTELCFLNKDTGIIGTEMGEVARTVDGGKNWKKLPNFLNDTFPVINILVKPGKATGYLLNAKKLYSFTELGDTFKLEKELTGDSLFSGLTYDGSKYGYLYGSHGLLLRSENLGINWSKININTSQYIISVSFPDTNNGFIMDSSRILFSSINSGTTWQSFSYQTFGNYSPNPYGSFLFLNSKEGFMVGEDNELLRTDDGGKNWFFQYRIFYSGIIKLQHSKKFPNFLLFGRGYTFNKGGMVITGKVFDKDSNEVNNRTDKLFAYNSNNGEFNNVLTQSGGIFYFENLEPKKYLLLSMAKDTLKYPTLLPTYYGNTLFWESALGVGDSSKIYKDINIVLQAKATYLPESGDTGRIMGDIMDSSGTKPRAGVDLILLNSSREAIKFTQTDTAGRFRFDKLKKGSYEAFPRIAGLPVDTNGARVKIWVDPLEEKQREFFIRFKADTDKIVVLMRYSLGIDNPEENTYSILLYPNPARSSFHIQSEVTNTPLQLSYSIYDLVGKKILSGENIFLSAGEKLSLDIRNCSLGMYFVDLFITVNEHEKIRKTVKVVLGR